MNYTDLSSEHINDHIDRIIDVADAIEPGKVTILTGSNSTGKSVVRKLLGFRMMEKLKLDNTPVATISMEKRTNGCSSLLGTGLDHAMSDLPWDSTSNTSVHTVVNMMDSLVIKEDERSRDNKKAYIVIDEIEIGMSREMQVGICNYLNEIFEKYLDNCYGVVVITHSETIVKNLKHDVFLNIDGMTEEEWLNREIVPITPKQISDWSSALFSGIENRTAENKKKSKK
jgi:archaellum biogenesis ATPase FlaH